MAFLKILNINPITSFESLMKILAKEEMADLETKELAGFQRDTR